MSDKKDTSKDEPEQLTDEQLAGVAGAGKFSAVRTNEQYTITRKLDGVNNDTIFAGPGDGSATTGIKGTDQLKKR